MRQLKPEVAEKRKRDLLQWVVHYFIRTSHPVASQAIAKESGLDLSSATIRTILQELEDEGYLSQPHTSAGRKPTDKGYRFFVDYLMDIQRLAAKERDTIERQYTRRAAELDTLLSETSRVLSRVSHGAGLVLSARHQDEPIKRLELVSAGGRHLVAVLVNRAGMVKHWPIKLSFVPTERQLNLLNRFLNDNVQGRDVREAKALITEHLKELEREFQQLSVLAAELVDELGRVVLPESLYMEGAENILTAVPEAEGDFGKMQALMRLLQERRVLTGLLEADLRGDLRLQDGDGAGGADSRAGNAAVRIGAESGVPELADLSLVTRVYRHKDRPVGVLGILGSKRMEYSRMMSFVDYMSGLVSRELGSWSEDGEGDG